MVKNSREEVEPFPEHKLPLPLLPLERVDELPRTLRDRLFVPLHRSCAERAVSRSASAEVLIDVLDPYKRQVRIGLAEHAPDVLCQTCVSEKGVERAKTEIGARHTRAFGHTSRSPHDRIRGRCRADRELVWTCRINRLSYQHLLRDRSRERAQSYRTEQRLRTSRAVYRCTDARTRTD